MQGRGDSQENVNHADQARSRLAAMSRSMVDDLWEEAKKDELDRRVTRRLA